MANEKFTPEPWYFDGTVIKCSDGNLWFCEARTDEEVIYNSYLSAAAPDLYNALKPFAALLQPHHNAIKDETPVFQINDAIITAGDLRRAQTALAKARGEEQEEDSPSSGDQLLDELHQSAPTPYDQ